ncbi:heterokaryon incompatibility protein-domain-containing protein [Dactylonectria estremocensis]|uniref:Heterokaryon incompatibility protein-domain-containing protein n=1 Tax=Dactylonectria estremocensis TaxID=1079267 RepID=A0A9P9EH47_9HYPO|nr:heterokaryon incompatibility protein-domain-containing protein [Dactylonectria estremocensis]
MEERYTYNPLDRNNAEIRLVKLEMSTADDDVSCELLTVPLASAPPYEALSYTWGSPLNKRKILMDGKPFQVTRNLFAALQHLRNPTTHRLLWIDAICINQEDIDERNCQVRLMWHIYAIAGQVSVWLGEEADDSAVAMEMIRMLAKNYDIQMSKAIEQFRKEGELARDRLLERPWWRRVWVIQEVAASRGHPVWVGCGQSWLPWDAFMEAALGIENMKGHPFFERVNRLGEGTKWILDKATLKVAPDPRQERRDNWPGLLNYLHLTSSYSATDPRDKVFALLGLVPGLSIIPDYKEPVEQVFGNLVKESIRATHSLMMLVLQRKPRRLALPSWVPDLSTEVDRGLFNGGCPMGFYSADGNGWYNLGIGSVLCQLVEDDPPHQLTVTGFIHDKPLVLAETWTSGKDERQSSAYKVIQNYSKLLEDTDTQHFPRKSGNHRQECFWRTLIWNATETDRYPAPDTYEAFFRRFKGGHDILISRSNPSADTADHQKIAPTDEARDFYNAFVKHGLNRRFFITARGNLGSGPTDMQEGDHICVLMGSKVPVVLRDVEEKPGCYEYVGHAYVHGIMHGEALALLDLEAETDRDGSRRIGIRSMCLV